MFNKCVFHAWKSERENFHLVSSKQYLISKLYNFLVKYKISSRINDDDEIHKDVNINIEWKEKYLIYIYAIPFFLTVRNNNKYSLVGQY